MLNKFFIFGLLLTAGLSMSFSSFNVSQVTSGKSGGTLTVTNPSAGTAVLAWSFVQPGGTTTSFIIEDVVHRTIVGAGSTSASTTTVTSLNPGLYRFTVSNGTNYIVVEDIVVM